MSENVQTYFEMLKKQSSEDLDSQARELALMEKQNNTRLIAHIAEIGDRNYHLKLGYKNLFTYCVKRFNLSEGSVWRRTQVAGICRKYPQILDALSDGRLHLTSACLIAPHLTVDNVENLITQAQGKSKRELKALLIKLAPKKPFKPSVRKKSGDVKERETDMKTSRAENRTTETSRTDPRTEETPAPSFSTKRTHNILEPATEEMYNFRFSATKAFNEKFNRLAEVLGIECAHKHIEDILDQAIEIALDKKDPKRKLERRRKREAGTSSPGDVNYNDEENFGAEQSVAKKHARQEKAKPETTRYISSEVRERVFERAGYRCEYQGPDGVRCSCRTGLQIEHTLPFAVYQNNDEAYLKAYCRAHNRFAAEEFYGHEFIDKKVEAQQKEQSTRSGVKQTAQALYVS